MTRAIVGLPPHIRARLADGLATGLLDDVTNVALRGVIGADQDVDGVLADLAALAGKEIAGPAAAAWIEALDAALAQQSRPDLVWSGEEIDGLHARDTRAVYEQLLGTARESLWVSSYAYFDGPRAFEILATRMDAVPELRVTLLLNIQRAKGDSSQPADVARRFADQLWKKDWPGKRRPGVFYNPKSLEPDGPSEVLHAKAVVADLESVFVTSANLTEAAFDRNIEMGLLVRDRALALSAVRHFQVLIERGLLKALPGD